MRPTTQSISVNRTRRREEARHTAFIEHVRATLRLWNASDTSDLSTRFLYNGNVVVAVLTNCPIQHLLVAVSNGFVTNGVNIIYGHKTIGITPDQQSHTDRQKPTNYQSRMK